MSDPPIKRYRRDPSPKSEDSEEDGGYVPHVSVADHRRQQLVKLGRAEAGGSRLEAAGWPGHLFDLGHCLARYHQRERLEGVR